MSNEMEPLRPARGRLDSPQQEAYLNLWRTYERLRLLEDQLFARVDLTAQQYNAPRPVKAAHPRQVAKPPRAGAVRFATAGGVSEFVADVRSPAAPGGRAVRAVRPHGAAVQRPAAAQGGAPAEGRDAEPGGAAGLAGAGHHAARGQAGRAR